MAAAEQGAAAYDPATRLREFLKSSARMWLTPPLPRHPYRASWPVQFTPELF